MKSKRKQRLRSIFETLQRAALSPAYKKGLFSDEQPPSAFAMMTGGTKTCILGDCLENSLEMDEKLWAESTSGSLVSNKYNVKGIIKICT